MRSHPTLTRRLAPLLLAITLCAALPAGVQAASGSPVREVSTSFSVRNVNGSELACATDGRRYAIRGHLVGTRAALKNPRAVTLYLHGLGFGEFFWRYRSAKGYDFASGMAKRGHVSVVIDRLGYGSSGKPTGMASCLGGQATIAHQIIGQLRSGRYHGSVTPRFRRVGLVGHSAGGSIAQIETYSFGDAHALGVLSYADQGISALQKNAGAVSSQICAAGGQPVGRANGYALLGQNAQEARTGFFSTTPANVFAKLAPILTRNPCGDLASYLAAMPVSLSKVKEIRKPVFLLQADRDALFPPPAVRNQARLYTHAKRVTYRSLPASAHAVTFERGKIQLQRDLSAWLSRNDL